MARKRAPSDHAKGVGRRPVAAPDLKGGPLPGAGKRENLEPGLQAEVGGVATVVAIPKSLGPWSPEVTGKLLYQLRIHEIGAGMQNDELRSCQAQLEASRERCTDLFDSAPFGYFTLSEEGAILEANLTIAALLGVPRGALIGEPSSHFILPDEQDLYDRFRKSLLSGTANQAIELHMASAKSVSFWVRIEGVAALDRSGTPICRAVVSDISKRKLGEDALRVSELTSRQRGEEFKRLTDLAPIPILVAHDPECREITGNATANTLWEARRDENVSAEPAIGERNTTRRYFQAGRELRPEELPMEVAARTGEDVRNSELEVLLPSGKRSTVLGNASPLRDDDGRVRGCVGAFVDITERKRSEEVMTFLAQSSSTAPDEDFFASLARYLSATLEMEYVCVDRLDGEGTAAQTVAVWHDGRLGNPADAIGGPPGSEVAAKAAWCFPAGVCGLFPTDQALQELRAESYAGVTLFDHFGQPIGVITAVGRSPLSNPAAADAVLRLVAVRAAGEMERRRAEEALLRSQAQLLQAQKMEAVGQLAGGVAHDFNNILQALLSSATLLRLRSGPAETARTVAQIETLIRRGAELTQQLLLFSRCEVAKTECVDLGELAGMAGDLLRRLIPENTRLAIEATCGRTFVEGDPGQIQQTIMNLAVNGKDAMPAGGTLTVRTGGDDSEAFLEVVDTGDGMDERTRAHIFEPFFTTKEKNKGTGLGLSVVHGIVERHGGRIEVQSSPGRGTRFRITFPAATPAKESPAAKPRKYGRLLMGHGERLLLVEDEESTRRALAEALELLGYRVTAVASGEDAGVLPARPAPDLLLTDLVLPGMTGSDLARGLCDRWPGLAVILMSGYTNDVAVRRDAENGHVHFLQKPFEMNNLARELRVALSDGKGVS